MRAWQTVPGVKTTNQVGNMQTEDPILHWYPVNSHCKFSIPTMRYRANKLTSFWPRWEDLEPFDAEMGLILKETTTSKSLATAWEEAIVSEKNGKGIDHWKRKLAAKHGIDDGKSPESRKRKGTPDFKLPPAYTREEPVDDEEGAYAFLPAWTNTEPKIKNEFHTTTGLDQKGELFKDHDSPNAGYAAQLNKRSKLDIAGRFSRPGTPVKNEGHSRGAISLAASKIRSTPFQPIMGTNDIE